MAMTVSETVTNPAQWMPDRCPDLEPPHVPWVWDASAFWRRVVADAPVDRQRTAALVGVNCQVRAVGGSPPWAGATTGTPYQVVAWAGGLTRVWDLARPVQWRWTGPRFPVEELPLPDVVRREGDPTDSFDRRWIGWDPTAQRLTEVCQLNRNHNLLLRWIAGVEWTGGWDGAAPGPWTWDTTKAWNASGQPRGSTATGLPLLPLVARWDEVRRGRIDHALALTLPEYGPGFVAPARGSDGRMAGHPCRGGERLRLRREAVTRWEPGSAARVVAEALATFGCLIVDTGGIGAVLCAQDRRFWEGDAGIAGFAETGFAVHLTDFEVVN